MAGQSGKRMLFTSWHCVLDPSSGAALATRDLLEMLAARGWECRVFCGPQFDFDRGESHAQLLSDQRIEFEIRECDIAPVRFSLLHYLQNGVSATIYSPERNEGNRRAPPTEDEDRPFLALLDRILQRERPEIVLTYGGQWLARPAIRLCRERGARVVFALHNFAYRDAGLFADVDAIRVPSQFAANYYRHTLGLAATVIPSAINWSRVLCAPGEMQPKSLTFVNPQPEKGVFVFARIAAELAERRPDIPLLVVEGRSTVEWLRHTGVDLSRHPNLHRMANTPDPRDFYRVSRAVLMPSLWNESFGRIAAEALINGIPVLASRRGALQELLRDAGFLFDVPGQYTPATRVAPTADEVAPWIETVARLWDDAAFYERERERARAAAEAWRPDVVSAQYDSFLRRLLPQ